MKHCKNPHPCWEDGACRFTGHCEHKFVTNADRINEKLAETLSGMCKIAEQCDYCPMEGNCPGGSYDLDVWMKWLKQPVEDNQ